MSYNKKQMQPLIDKFKINPETNQLFSKIIEMYDNQPNYQIWAVKGVFSNAFDFDTLAKIHDWSVINQTMIKNLEKKNIVSYSTKTAIAQLFKEMKALDNISVIKSVISHFNTDQRKMLTEKILPREFNGLEASHDANIKAWGEIMSKFNRLPLSRKNNFFTKASSIRDINELQSRIKSALEETYDWDKEDLLAYVENNTKGVDIVLNKGPYVILRIPNFQTSIKLCGGGRTQWCITMKQEHWDSYSGGDERDQYFLFDFTRRETDPFAHIGFTIKKGCGIVDAQTCDNQPMINDYFNGKETLNINTALEAVGAKMSTFIHLDAKSEFEWNVESLVSFINKHKESYAIAYSGNNRYVINCLSNEGINLLIGHSLISRALFFINDNTKVYVVVDMNLNVNDDKAIVALFYSKDQYGDVTLTEARDLFNGAMKNGNYLNSIGLSTDMFLNREAIDPSILLHKLIDENDELGAIKLIDDNIDTIDVNYQFNMRIPVFSALNANMFKLFNKIISMDNFDSTVTDGFGETLLQSFMYIYSADDVVLTKDNNDMLAQIVSTIIDNKKFDLNAHSISGDTALTTGAMYPKMDWIVKKLVSRKEVDVNMTNFMGMTPLGICIENNNIEAIKELGKRPDLVVNENDLKAAKKAGINLNDYIKPEFTFTYNEIDSMESLISELEKAASVASE